MPISDYDRLSSLDVIALVQRRLGCDEQAAQQFLEARRSDIEVAMFRHRGGDAILQQIVGILCDIETTQREINKITAANPPLRIKPRRSCAKARGYAYA